MRKLVLEINSEITVVMVEATGGAADPSTVLWDEKIHGPIPAEAVGKEQGLKRSGEKVVYDEVKYQAYVTAQAAKRTAAGAKATRITQAQTFLKNLDTSSPLNAAQLTNAVKSIVILLKDLSSQIE